MLVALNTSLRRRGRRVGILLSVVALSLAVVSAHGAVAGGHMAPTPGGHAAMVGAHGMGGADATGDATVAAPAPGGTLMAMCLALAQTAALALGALALARALAALHLLGSTLRWPTPRFALMPRDALAPRARPPDLSVLQVFRR